MKTTTKKFLSLAAVLVIFYFLFRELGTNWEKIKGYDFIFNYWSLSFSYLIFFVNSVLFGLSWFYILRCLDPDLKINKYQAFKVATYTKLTKYIPGKIWPFVGRVYLGSYYNISKKNLLISSLFQPLISIINGALLGVLLLFLIFDPKYSLLLMLLFPVIGLTILLNPGLFYQILNFVIKRINKKSIKEFHYPGKKQLLFIYFQVLLIQILNGTAAFFMIRSFTETPWSYWPGIVAMLIVSNVLGLIAAFSPGGLGVREGVLAFLMRLYYPIGLSILISLLARIWLLAGEIGITILVYLFDLVKTKLPLGQRGN